MNIVPWSVIISCDNPCSFHTPCGNLNRPAPQSVFLCSEWGAPFPSTNPLSLGLRLDLWLEVALWCGPLLPTSRSSMVIRFLLGVLYRPPAWFFGISGNFGHTVLRYSWFRPVSNFFLFLTRLPLYPGALLACGCDFSSVSSQSCPAGLFFFLNIAIDCFFFPTWQCCDGGGSLCFLPSWVPYSEKILVEVWGVWYCLIFLIMRWLLHFLPPSCRLCDRARPVFPVPPLPVARWLFWLLRSRSNFCDQ